MLDIGFSELALIGVVALIVVGPKDLPIMFRTLGRFTAKARSMGREFQRAMDEAAKQSGVGDALKDVKDLTSKKSLGLNALESAASKFEKWNPAIPGAKPQVPKVVLPPNPVLSTPPAVAATDPAKIGPATKALAEKRAAERAARLAPKEPAAEPAVAEPAAAPAAKAAKAPRKTSVKTAAAADAAKPAAAKPRSRAKKSPEA